MSAEKLSKLVAEAAANQSAPVPAGMEHLSLSGMDGVQRAYLLGNEMVWCRDVDLPAFPADARPLYVKAV